jgi:hypothetical protein
MFQRKSHWKEGTGNGKNTKDSEPANEKQSSGLFWTGPSTEINNRTGWWRYGIRNSENGDTIFQPHQNSERYCEIVSIA